ncbi:MAG: hypothetical protein KatS3mg113_0046 [Planctomycetaceae bacterium]|nr:MAG: hypothetical protein KatS3mg113_0046 [Planctomycetaceae bacterium]
MVLTRGKSRDYVRNVGHQESRWLGCRFWLLAGVIWSLLHMPLPLVHRHHEGWLLLADHLHQAHRHEAEDSGWCWHVHLSLPWQDSLPSDPQGNPSPTPSWLAVITPPVISQWLKCNNSPSLILPPLAPLMISPQQLDKRRRQVRACECAHCPPHCRLCSFLC